MESSDINKRKMTQLLTNMSNELIKDVITNLGFSEHAKDNKSIKIDFIVNIRALSANDILETIDTESLKTFSPILGVDFNNKQRDQIIKVILRHLNKGNIKGLPIELSKGEKLSFELEYFGSSDNPDKTGNCFCCNRLLKYGEVGDKEWNYGHMISASEGGSPLVSNRCLLCRKCNTNMKTKSVYEYKELLKHKSNLISDLKSLASENKDEDIDIKSDEIIDIESNEDIDIDSKNEIIDIESKNEIIDIESDEDIDIDSKKFNVVKKKPEDENEDLTSEVKNLTSEVKNLTSEVKKILNSKSKLSSDLRSLSSKVENLTSEYEESNESNSKKFDMVQEKQLLFEKSLEIVLGQIKSLMLSIQPPKELKSHFITIGTININIFEPTLIYLRIHDVSTNNTKFMFDIGHENVSSKRIEIIYPFNNCKTIFKCASEINNEFKCLKYQDQYREFTMLIRKSAILYFDENDIFYRGNSKSQILSISAKNHAEY